MKETAVELFPLFYIRKLVFYLKAPSYSFRIERGKSKKNKIGKFMKNQFKKKYQIYKQS